MSNNKEITPTRIGLGDVVNPAQNTEQDFPVNKKSNGITLGSINKNFNPLTAKTSTVDIATKEHYAGIQQSGTDPLEIFGQNQSLGTKYAKSAMRIAPVFAGNLIEGAGYVGGLLLGSVAAIAPGVDMNDAIKFADDNYVSKFGQAINDTVKNDWLPIYHTREYLDSTSAMYKVFGEGAEGISEGISFLASAIVPGMAFSKIKAGSSIVKLMSKQAAKISKATKLAKLGKTKEAERVIREAVELGRKGKLKNINKLTDDILKDPSILSKKYDKIAKGIDYMSLHTYNTINEAMFEAVDVYNRAFDINLWKQDKEGKLITQEEMDKVRKTAFAKTFGYNVALLSLTNLPETTAIFKTFGQYKMTARRAKKIVDAGMTKGKKAMYLAKGVAEQSIAEGVFEEGGQLAISDYALYGDKNEYFGKDRGDIISIFSNMINNFDTVEGRENMITGALIGSFFGGSTNLTDALRYQKAAKNYLDYMKERRNVIDNYIDNVLTKDENGNIVFDKEKIMSVANDIAKGDDVKKAFLSLIDELNDDSLYDYVMDLEFNNTFASAVFKADSFDDLKTEIDYFVAKQQEAIKNMPEGTAKEEQLKKLNKLKSNYYDTAKSMFNAWEKAKGIAYDQYVDSNIALDEKKLNTKARMIYANMIDSALTLKFIGRFNAAISELENDLNIEANSEDNKKIMNYHVNKQRIEQYDENIKQYEDAIKEIEDLIKKAKDEGKEVIINNI